MLSDREEHIIQQLHIIALMLDRSCRHAGSHPIMSRRYAERTVTLIGELMEFVEPTGRIIPDGTRTVKG